MSDQQLAVTRDESAPTTAPTTVTVTKTAMIRPPKTILVLHYRLFEQARRAYEKKCKLLDQDVVDEIADFVASRALILGYEFFQVEGPDEFFALLREEDVDKLPAEFINAINFRVGWAIRRAVNRPLQGTATWTITDSSTPSSATS